MNSIQVENIGMRYIDGSVCCYSQTKTGLTAKYNKKHLLEDRITTYPLMAGDYESISYIFICGK